MSQPQTPSSPPSFATTFATLLAHAEAAWKAIEGGVEQFFATEIPVLEQDVVSALEQFGSTATTIAVNTLAAGIPQGETISTVANHFIESVEATGKTILNQTARTAATQVVGAAQVKLGALAASNPTGS